MGQASNSHRGADLDDSKERAQGRQQNDPARREIADREDMHPVGGAFGAEGQANDADTNGVAPGGGTDKGRNVPGPDEVGQSSRPAKKREG